MLSASLLVSGICHSEPQYRVQANSQFDAAPACATHASWMNVKTGSFIRGNELFRDLAANARIVLLGETHTNVDHHHWQLHTLAALQGRTSNIVIGFEAFPRRLQSVLDDWVEGKLTPEAFLTASEWRRVWGYDPALYMPLFQFARIHRIPMIALNVERSLVSRVGKHGWDSVPSELREGLSDPAPATPSYQRELAGIYRMKRTANAGEDSSASQQSPAPEPDEQVMAEVMKDAEFKHFVQAQQTWDRAMAEALVGAKRKFSSATIVGIIGSGHLTGGHGVPHQLRDLGVTGITTLIPVSTETACRIVGSSYADVVFTLPPGPKETLRPERPRLGVVLTKGEDAPRVDRVASNSVAEAAGLQAGDHVLRAAGIETRNASDLVDIIARQAPGTWLPLSIRRDGQEIEVIAKFPAQRRQDP
jgi:uncharacterized iron-regulated protein